MTKRRLPQYIRDHTAPPFDGTGVGRGHGGNSDLPTIRPIPEPAIVTTLKRAGKMNASAAAYQMGKCRIIVAVEENVGWHLSISRPDQYPSWDEIAKARYELTPKTIRMAFVLPPEDQYVNVHSFTFHLFQLRENGGDVPPMPPMDIKS